MDKAFVIKKGIRGIYPDEIHGLLYCYTGGTKMFVVDTDSCEIVGEFKVAMNSFHFYFSETKDFLFAQETASKITVWQVNKYDEPYWKIKLKGTVNSDAEFVCLDNALYGFCDSYKGTQPATRYFVIDLLAREIKTELCLFFITYRKNSVGGEIHDAVEKVYDSCLNYQRKKLLSVYTTIPEKYNAIFKLMSSSDQGLLQLMSKNGDAYYETNKFGFLVANSRLIAIPHGAELTEKVLGVKQAEKEKSADYTEEYIKTHGLTKEFVNDADDGEILYFGYFWALEQITRKAEAANMTFDSFLCNEAITDIENILFSIGWFQTEIDEGGTEQYFCNGNKEEFDSLIKALTIVGASETAKVINKCVDIQLKYNALQTPSEKDDEKRAEKIEAIWDDVTEDYVDKATAYVKQVILSAD